MTRHETFSGSRPSFASPRAGGEDVDLGLIWSALKRRSPWILGITLLALVGSFLAVNLVTPRYTSAARLLLESRENFYTRLGTSEREVPSFDAEAVQSQVQVIMSRDLAREAVNQLGLVGNPEFDPVVAGMGPIKRLMVLTGLTRNPAERAPDDRVIDAFYERLLVYAVGKSRVVEIEFSSRDPDLAARAANLVATLYLGMLGDAKKDTARFASTWLAGTIEPLRQRVAEAEAKVEEFRARTGLLAGANNATLTTLQLGELSTQLSSARNVQADTQAKASLIRDLIKSGRILEIPDVANNDLIRRLAEQRITLRGQLALESRTLLGQHPRIKELNAQLADLDQQIRAAAERTVRTLENDAKVVGSRVDALVAALDGQKTVAVGANENEIQLRAFERDARTQREQLESYLVRYREALARDTENAQPADARVVSRAVASTLPSFPKKLPIIVLATLAAFVLSGGLVVARELLTGHAMSGGGLRQAADDEPLPAEAVTPSAAASPDVASVRIMSAPASASFGAEPALPTPEVKAATAAEPVVLASLDPTSPGGTLRTVGAGKALPDFHAVGAGSPLSGPYGELLQQMPPARADGRGRKILATEPQNGHGAAAAARALARHLARNERVILVSVADDAISPDRLGLADLVGAKTSFAEIIERETGSRLHLMAPGTGDPSSLTRTPEMADLAFSALEQTYDWVFFLVPGAERPALADFFASRVDGVVLAAHQADMEQGAVGEIHEGLQAAGAKHIVVALTAEAKPPAATAAA